MPPEDLISEEAMEKQVQEEEEQRWELEAGWIGQYFSSVPITFRLQPKRNLGNNLVLIFDNLTIWEKNEPKARLCSGT